MKILPGLSKGASLILPLGSTGQDRSLLLNAAYIFGVNISPGLIGLAYWSTAGRWFQPEQIGLASSLISVVSLLGGFGALGMGYALLRFLPQADQPLRLLNSAYTLSAGLSLAAAIAFIAGAGRWFPEFAQLGAGLLPGLVFLLFVVSVSLGSLVRDTFVARRQSSYAWRYTLLAALARPVLLLPLASLGASGLIASSALAFGLALAVSAILFLPKVQPGYRLAIVFDWPVIARLLPYSCGNYLVVLLTQLSQTLLPLLVLKQLGPAASGFAFIALMIAGLAAAPGIALSTSALAESASQPGTAETVLRKSASYGLLLSLVIGGLLCLLAPLILQAISTSYAQQAARLLRLLALSTPLFVLVQFHFTQLRYQQKTRRLVLLSGLLVSLTLVPAWIYLPDLGIAAVGMASLLSNAILCGIILLSSNNTGQAVQTVIE